MQHDGLAKALAEIKKHLVANGKEPGGYYYIWQANIAMAIYDEIDGYGIIPTSMLHEMANAAAQRFLDQLIATT